MKDQNPENSENPFELEVSKVGTFVPMGGKKVTITPDMLQEMADTYDPEVSPSPFVLGHPKVDDPAFGWGDKMVFRDDRLFMLGDREKIDQGFKDMVAKGDYKKVSLAWYEPDAPGNPTPGKRYPKHVGCLGAIAGAVPLDPKGLDVLNEQHFGDGSDEGVIECSYAVHSIIPRIFRGIRDWLIEKEGVEAADAVIRDWEIQSIEEEGHQAEASKAADESPHFSEPDEVNMTEAEIAQLQADNERLQAANSTLTSENENLQSTVTKFQDRSSADRANDIKAFCDGLVDNERMMPEVAQELNDVLTSLDTDDSGVFAFSDGSEAPSATKALMDVVTKALDYSFDFDEKGQDDETVGVQQFASVPGTTVSQDKLETLQKAKQIVADSGNKVTILQAVQQVENAS